MPGRGEGTEHIAKLAGRAVAEEPPRYGQPDRPRRGQRGSRIFLPNLLGVSALKSCHDKLPIVPVMGKDSLAQIIPAGTSVGRPSATARRLVDASVSANSRRAYAGALRRLDAWLARPRSSMTRPSRPPRRAPRRRRRGSGPNSPGNRVLPVRLPPEFSPATAELPPTAAAARPERSRPRTWRPCSPRATFRGAAAGE